MRVITKTNVQIDLPDGTYLELFDPDPRVVAYLESIESAVKAEREACAKVCEEQRDLREEARATLRASDALKIGDEDAMLHALRHESNVRLYHAGIDKCAAAIRERGTNGQ